MNRKKSWIIYSGAAIFALISVLISLNLGSVRFNYFTALFRRDEVLSMLVFLRQYRVLAGFFVGGSLSVSGIIFQALLKNPLAEPFVLGVSSGAALGSAMFLMFLGTSTLFMASLSNITAFCGAFIAVLIVYLLSRVHGKISIQTLLLSGVVVASVSSSILLLVISLFPQKIVGGVIWWLLGDLQVVSSITLIFLSFSSIFGLIIACLFSKSLNAFIILLSFWE